MAHDCRDPQSDIYNFSASPPPCTPPNVSEPPPPPSPGPPRPALPQTGSRQLPTVQGQVTETACTEPQGFECACPEDRKSKLEGETYRHERYVSALRPGSPRDQAAAAWESRFHQCCLDAIHSQNCPEALEPCATGPGGPAVCGGCGQVASRLTAQPLHASTSCVSAPYDVRNDVPDADPTLRYTLGFDVGFAGCVEKQTTVQNLALSALGATFKTISAILAVASAPDVIHAVLHPPGTSASANPYLRGKEEGSRLGESP